MSEPPLDTTDGPRLVLERMLPILRDKKLTMLADMYAENAVHELPFAPPGAPARLTGREMVREYYITVLSRIPLDFDDFRPVAIHDTADPEVIIAEYDAHGTVSTTGKRFTTRFVWVLRISGGRIHLWRDYMNPRQIMELQSEAP